MRAKVGSNKAFTLIEIIIALTILGIGLISVMAYLPVALDATRKASDLTKASLLAQSVLEEIKSVSANDITQADNFDLGTYFSSSLYPGFAYKVEINPKGVVPYKSVNIIIQWKFKNKIINDSYWTQIVKYNPT